MTKRPHDSFSKQYLKGILSPFGEEVQISLELPPGESQQVDVWFIPKSHQPITELGILGQMVITPTLLEVFRNPIAEDDFFACIEKLCKVRAELKRIAKRKKHKIPTTDKPYLWFLVPTASAKTLEGCHAYPQPNWCDGFFFLGDTFRIGFVVIHQLPVIPDTLLLRLLGRDAVQRQAIAELLELPQQPLKTFVLEKLTKLQVMLKNRTTISKADQDTMDNIDVVYEEWRNKTLQEGRQEADRAALEAMLVAKFGTIDQTLEGIVPLLLTLEPVERARSVMQLSREDLLNLF